MRTSCPTGKVGYRSPQQAHEMNMSAKIKRRVLAVYRCDDCPSWHLGSNEYARVRLREFKWRKLVLAMLPMCPDDY